MYLVSISTGNAQWRVHEKGCGDIQKESVKYGAYGGPDSDGEFESRRQYAAFLFGDIAGDNYESESAEWWDAVMRQFRSDVTMLRCTRDLP